jgi:hypothetical protein
MVEPARCLSSCFRGGTGLPLGKITHVHSPRAAAGIVRTFSPSILFGQSRGNDFGVDSKPPWTNGSPNSPKVSRLDFLRFDDPRRVLVEETHQGEG